MENQFFSDKINLQKVSELFIFSRYTKIFGAQKTSAHPYPNAILILRMRTFFLSEDPYHLSPHHLPLWLLFRILPTDFQGK